MLYFFNKAYSGDYIRAAEEPSSAKHVFTPAKHSPKPAAASRKSPKVAASPKATKAAASPKAAVVTNEAGVKAKAKAAAAAAGLKKPAGRVQKKPASLKKPAASKKH